MLIKPVSINGNLCKKFESCREEDLSVMEGGYIITPNGEVIVVKDKDEHHIVFSEYINAYLELKTDEVYNTFQATKMLCEIGCCVYSGIRLEYVKNKLESLDKSMASLTFPNDFDSLSNIQKELCIKLIETNKSLFKTGEKISIQYGSLPDNVYTKDEIVSILNKKTSKKGNLI